MHVCAWRAVLVCLGLLMMLLTLVQIHPLAFVAFIVIACPLVLDGGFCSFTRSSSISLSREHRTNGIRDLVSI